MEVLDGTLSAVSLTLDPERGIRTEHCATCATDYVCVTGFVYREGTPLAVYYAALHGHDDAHEAWLDVTLSEGADGQGPRVTLGCRIGDFGSHGGLGAALTDGGLELEDPAVTGLRLTAEQALADRRLEEFWEVVDFVLVADDEIRTHTHD